VYVRITIPRSTNPIPEGGGRKRNFKFFDRAFFERLIITIFCRHLEEIKPFFVIPPIKQGSVINKDSGLVSNSSNRTLPKIQHAYYQDSVSSDRGWRNVDLVISLLCVYYTLCNRPSNFVTFIFIINIKFSTRFLRI